jgi:dihydrofolate reductase
MRLAIIAAVASNGVIGRNNQLPWHLSQDLKRFKALTLGHHLIMGRRTFESIGRPLPGRTLVVITRQRDFAPEGVRVTHSLDEAIGIAATAGDAEPFIAGGAEVYSLAIHRADRMYLTRVHAHVDGDTCFPAFDDVSEWVLTSTEHFDADAKNDYPSSFLTYDRKSSRPL